MNRLLLMIGLSIFGLLPMVGCRSSVVESDYKNGVAVDWALATMTNRQWPFPSPSPVYQCPRCQDTGWIMHGDGHRTRCPDCNRGKKKPSEPGNERRPDPSVMEPKETTYRRRWFGRRSH